MDTTKIVVVVAILVAIATVMALVAFIRGRKIARDEWRAKRCLPGLPYGDIDDPRVLCPGRTIVAFTMDRGRTQRSGRLSSINGQKIKVRTEDNLPEIVVSRDLFNVNIIRY